MSMEGGLSEYLEHMRQEAAEACRFVDGVSRKDFLEDKLRQKGVIMSIVAIGEAVRKIEKRYPEFIRAHPEIQWRKIYDTRNRAAHGYFDLNLDRIWNLSQTGLPELLVLLAAIQVKE